jgi:hypothetical protein
LQTTLFKRKIILAAKEGKPAESMANDFQYFIGDGHDFRELVKARYMQL